MIIINIPLYFCVHTSQPSSQPEIDHSTLTADYPRYMNVFELKLNQEEKQCLMVCVIYLHPRFVYYYVEVILMLLD